MTKQNILELKEVLQASKEDMETLFNIILEVITENPILSGELKAISFIWDELLELKGLKATKNRLHCIMEQSTENDKVLYNATEIVCSEIDLAITMTTGAITLLIDDFIAGTYNN